MYVNLFVRFFIYKLRQKRHAKCIQLRPEDLVMKVLRYKLFKPDLCRAEPCFEMRSLHVLRSSTLLPRVLRADWTSEFCEPPPCPGAAGADDGEKSSPESSVNNESKRKGKNISLKKGFMQSCSHFLSRILKFTEQEHKYLSSPCCLFYLTQPACGLP